MYLKLEIHVGNSNHWHPSLPQIWCRSLPQLWKLLATLATKVLPP